MRLRHLAFLVPLCAASVALAAEGDVRVIVGFKGPANAAVAASAGARILESNSRFVVASVAPKRVATLRANPLVAYVEKDVVVHATASPQTTPWGVSRVWGGTMPGANGVGVRVAVIDTGIDLTHPDLQANIAGNVTFVAGTSNGNDDNGHGSHVAGTVAAVNDAFGVVGVAPRASLYAVKVLDRNGSGFTSAIANSLYWAVANQINVANMSLGSPTGTTTLSTACTVASNAGVLLIAAAGNSGDGFTSTNEWNYPAAYSAVVSVGATDSLDRLAKFSNTNSDLEVSGPGVAIFSTYKNHGYATLSGTSMASPHAAGLAALIWNEVTPALNMGAAVRTELQRRVRDRGAPGRDKGFGFGIVRY